MICNKVPFLFFLTFNVILIFNVNRKLIFFVPKCSILPKSEKERVREKHPDGEKESMFKKFRIVQNNVHLHRHINFIV